MATSAVPPNLGARRAHCRTTTLFKRVPVCSLCPGPVLTVSHLPGLPSRVWLLLLVQGPSQKSWAGGKASPGPLLAPQGALGCQGCSWVPEGCPESPAGVAWGRERSLARGALPKPHSGPLLRMLQSRPKLAFRVYVSWQLLPLRCSVGRQWGPVSLSGLLFQLAAPQVRGSPDPHQQPGRSPHDVVPRAGHVLVPGSGWVGQQHQAQQGEASPGSSGAQPPNHVRTRGGDAKGGSEAARGRRKGTQIPRRGTAMQQQRHKVAAISWQPTFRLNGERASQEVEMGSPFLSLSPASPTGI